MRESSEAGHNTVLRARTTYKLIRPFEAMALLLQATNLATSAINDRYRPAGVPILLALAAGHLVLAAVVVRHRGPLTRGHAWTGVWIAEMFVMQLVVATLLLPGDFAGYGYGVQVGNFSLIPLAVLAFYPWGGFRNRRRRWVIEAGLIAAIIIHPLLIVGIMNAWQLTGAQVKSVGQYAVWAVVWYLVGKGLAKLCRIAVAVQSEALVHSYEAALGDLHTHVEIAVRSIAAGENADDAAQKLRDVVYTRRRQLLLEDPQVGAVDIFKNAIRLFGERLTLLSSPRLGGLTLPNDRAMVLERGLVDLLKNAVDHGGGAVRLGFDLKDELMVLTVSDTGPGLTADDFAAPGSTMHRISGEVRPLGGSLVLANSGDAGTTVQLTLPLRGDR
ncbi:ATP-binding protein [Amycolatopsis nalaikhensis]|uniref:ATP-binding protein n=1 Tax=Amycolatopsis nalaikhensis TaxID=715472 RepID=A0ABY8XQP0_9PSEU|nr:ATP-binding protein [Amycolatopsis sp. 2-2]WIV57975.1 ATP-binding protein [Amycolatopsis sp. 2-2]